MNISGRGNPDVGSGLFGPQNPVKSQPDPSSIRKKVGGQEESMEKGQEESRKEGQEESKEGRTGRVQGRTGRK